MLNQSLTVASEDDGQRIRSPAERLIAVVGTPVPEDDDQKKSVFVPLSHQPQSNLKADPSVPDDDDDHAHDSSNCNEANPSCCITLKAWLRRWRPLLLIMLLNLLNGVANTILSPMLPGIKRRYFGSDHEAAFASTLMQAISAFLGMFLAPLVGMLTDSWGRRPFFLINYGGNVVAKVLLLINVENPMGNMIAQNVLNAIGNSVINTYLADAYSPRVRAQAFAALFASGSVTSIASLFVLSLSDFQLASISVGLSSVALGISLFLGESLPRHQRRQLSCQSLHNPFKAMKGVVTSKVMLIAVIIMGVFSVSQSGIMEVYMFFLNERVGFGKKDNAWCYLEMGITVPFVLLVVVPWLTRCLKLRQVTLVMASCVALACEMITMCFLFEKWQVFALGIPFAALVNISMPVVTAIVANGSDGTDQGRRQAGFSAIRDLFATIAPLAFGQTYSHLRGDWVVLPFAIAAVLSIPTFGLAWKLRGLIIKKEECMTDDDDDDADTPSVVSFDSSTSGSSDASETVDESTPILGLRADTSSSSNTDGQFRTHIRP